MYLLHVKPFRAQSSDAAPRYVLLRIAHLYTGFIAYHRENNSRKSRKQDFGKPTVKSESGTVNLITRLKSAVSYAELGRKFSLRSDREIISREKLNKNIIDSPVKVCPTERTNWKWKEYKTIFKSYLCVIRQTKQGDLISTGTTNCVRALPNEKGINFKKGNSRWRRIYQRGSD